MTITAAFVFDDGGDTGVFLCADTQHTVEPLQLESAKIFTRAYGKGAQTAHSAFAISGDVDFAVAALQSCERALTYLPAKDRKPARMQRVVEEVLGDFYARHLDPQPSPAWFRLYVVLASQGIHLFRTRRSALRELLGYDCDGAGAALAHYLIRNRYQAARVAKRLTLETVYTIGVEALKEVKEYVDGCGKATDVVVLYGDGRVKGPERILVDSSEGWATTFTKLT